ASNASTISDDQEEPSQQRLIADNLRGMPLKALLDLAIERIEAKDAKEALDICKIARESDPENADVRAAAIWASTLKSGADLKVLTVELDELIQSADRALLRYVRGLLRRRLGEDKGALNDFRRAFEIDPGLERAKREVDAVERPSTDKPAQSGLLKRLFGR